MDAFMIEVWKDIPNYEGLYQASNKGRIKSLSYRYHTGRRWFTKKGKILTFNNPSSNGYYMVCLSKNSVREYGTVHRFIGLAFLDLSEGKVVNHIDGNKLNNHLTNLEACTNSENILHAIRMGFHKRKHGPNKNIDIVKEIKTWLEEGFKPGEIEKVYSLTARSIRGIRAGHNWSEVNSYNVEAEPQRSKA